LKFLKTDGDNLVFQIGRREKTVLGELLGLYPVVPPAHYKISSTEQTPAMEGNQHLLEEALAEHRAENKQQLQAMMSDPDRFRETSSGLHLSLNPTQVEWLLQVLNDIRVGSWILLGSPDPKRGKRAALSLKSARHFWAMELAGHFQYVLLSAGH
jgi:hypothetical protein